MHNHTQTRHFCTQTRHFCFTSLYLISSVYAAFSPPSHPSHPPPLLFSRPSHPSPPPSLFPSLPKRVKRLRAIQPPYRIHQHIGHSYPHRARRQDLSRQRQSLIVHPNCIYYREPDEENARDGRALSILDVGNGIPGIPDGEVESEGEEGGSEEGVGVLVDEGGGDGAKESNADPDDGEGLGRWPV